MSRKCIKDVTFKEFDAWCNLRACDGQWSMETAMLCVSTVTEILNIKPFLGRNKAREKAWNQIKKERFNLDFEIEV